MSLNASTQPTPPSSAAFGAAALPLPNWLRRYPVATFLAALTVSLVASPLTESFALGDVIEPVRLTILMLAGLLAAGGSRRTLIYGAILVIPALVGKWTNHFHPDFVRPWVYLVPGLLFLTFVLRQLLRFTVRAPRVDSEVLCGGIAVYLLLGVLWSFGYILVAGFNPNAFTFTASGGSAQAMKGFTAVYYSFITLSTVGYGDIVPVSGAARVLAASEATVGVLYTTILVARLVTLYTSPTPAEDPQAAVNR